MTIRRAKIIHRFAFIMMVSFGFASQAETLEISASKELLWDQSQGVYKAIGDAKAVRGVQSISADLLQAYYNDQSEDQDIERIIATTNVRFADADLKGQGTELDYDISRDFLAVLYAILAIQGVTKNIFRRHIYKINQKIKNYENTSITKRNRTVTQAIK